MTTPEVEKAAQSFLTAFDNLDWELFRAAFAADATVFMPFSTIPKRLNGKEEVEAAFQAFFEQVRQQGKGPPYLNLQPADMKVQRVGDIGIVTFHLPDQTGLSRRTVIFQNRDGKWLIIHLHASNMQIPQTTSR